MAIEMSLKNRSCRTNGFFTVRNEEIRQHKKQYFQENIFYVMSYYDYNL